MARERMIGAVRQAVQSLPACMQEVVALCDLQEMDYATVAQVIQCPIGTMRSAASSARAAVEEAVGGAVDGDGESGVTMQNQVEQERALSEWLREVADADAASGASPAVQAVARVCRAAPRAGSRHSRCARWRQDS